MATVSVDLPLNVGDTEDFTLFLYDGSSLVNVGGDELTEDANGLFEATVSESLDVAKVYRADVDRDGVLIFSGWLRTAVSLKVDDPGVPPDQSIVISLLSGDRVIQVPSPNVEGNLVLTQGDTYDDIGNQKARWNVDTDYTDGWGVGLTIRDKDDNVVYFNAGQVDSAAAVSVAINAPTGLPMSGCPGVWQGKFDVELTKNQSTKTIANGVVYIYEDQTR